MRDLLIKPVLRRRMGKNSLRDRDAMGEADVFEHLLSQRAGAERLQSSFSSVLRCSSSLVRTNFSRKDAAIAEDVRVDDADESVKLHEGVLAAASP